jgi:hypothetical protein
MVWFHVAQDRDLRRASVNRVMNLSVPIKCCEILEPLRDWWLLKKDSAPWSSILHFPCACYKPHQYNSPAFDLR